MASSSNHDRAGTVIAFTGDFRLQLGPSIQALHHVHLCDEIVETLAGCSHVIVNLEGPLTNAPAVVTRGVALCSSRSAAEVLRALHCSVLNLGNNHIMDHGLAGYRDTRDLARACGWHCFGAGENAREAASPLVLPLQWGKVGMLAVCDLWKDKMSTASHAGVFCHRSVNEIRERLAALRSECRWVGINYHGGEELFRMPMPSRRRRLLQYAAAGADFVIAHHSHTVQGYEHVAGRVVYYGLGNFLFDVDYFPIGGRVDESVIAILNFTKSGLIKHVQLFTHYDRRTKRLERLGMHRWCRELTATTYCSDYEEYARCEFQEWMRIQGDSQPTKTRRLRRLVGMAFNLRNRYTRPVLLAAYRNIAAEWLRRFVSRTQIAGRHE